MAEPAKSSPLSELRIALPSLPMRLQEVGRFVAANDYDATTRSMRDLAAEAGADPAAFTRLAKAIGYSGWDELRAALTEARRPLQTSPFSARAKSRRHGPNADVALISDKLEAEIVIGFMPYTNASVRVAQAAYRAGATLIAIADSVAAPMAEGADHVLLFEAASSPGFFPSLTGAIAIAQSLAAVTFSLGGPGAKKRLEDTEARLAAASTYVPEKG